MLSDDKGISCQEVYDDSCNRKEIKATAAKTVLIRRNWTDQHHHLSFHQIKTAM